ncbi:MAG: ABC transporter ATP-binding protein, partial [Coriobacteriaceae bacterium]|nr:ABC transporter ATP-binding protein [Coriobacteriaceae bacterium]
MRLFRNLKGHVGALLLIFVLLIGQAVCDLALPTFTSDIVDVGIQQRGIQHATLEEMRAETYEALRELVDPADRAAFEAAYEQGEDGHYRLTQEARASLEELEAIEMRPAALLSVGAGNAIDEASMVLADDASGASGDELSDGIAAQRAIAFAQAEYEACGID